MCASSNPLNSLDVAKDVVRKTRPASYEAMSLIGDSAWEEFERELSRVKVYDLSELTSGVHRGQMALIDNRHSCGVSAAVNSPVTGLPVFLNFSVHDRSKDEVFANPLSACDTAVKLVAARNGYEGAGQLALRLEPADSAGYDSYLSLDMRLALNAVRRAGSQMMMGTVTSAFADTLSAKGIHAAAIEKALKPDWWEDEDTYNNLRWATEATDHATLRARLDAVGEHPALARYWRDFCTDEVASVLRTAGPLAAARLNFPGLTKHWYKATAHHAAVRRREFEELMASEVGRVYPARYMPPSNPDGCRKGVIALLNLHEKLTAISTAANLRRKPSDVSLAKSGYWKDQSALTRQTILARARSLYSDAASLQSPGADIWRRLGHATDMINDVNARLINPLLKHLPVSYDDASEEYRESARNAWWNVSLRAMRWEQIANLNANWHRHATSITRAANALNPSAMRWEPVAAPQTVTGSTGRSFLFEAVTEAEELYRLGDDQDHCVASYDRACAVDSTHIVTCSENGKVLATMEVRINAMGIPLMNQFMAAGNSMPEQDVIEAGQEYIRRLIEEKLVDQQALEQARAQREASMLDLSDAVSISAGYDTDVAENIETLYSTFRRYMPALFPQPDMQSWLNALSKNADVQAILEGRPRAEITPDACRDRRQSSLFST